MRSSGMRTFKNVITVMAVLLMIAGTAISCGKKESQTPAAGVDTTMTKSMSDTTGAAGGAAAKTDTTKAK